MNAKSIIKNVISKKIKLIISLLFFMILSVTLKMSIPLIVHHVIDNIILKNVIDTNLIVFWGLMMMTCALILFFIDIKRIKKTTLLGNEIVIALSQAAHSSLLRSEVLEFNKLETENIYNNITNQAKVIGQKYFSRGILTAIYNSLLFLSVMITIVLVNPWFFMYTIVALPIFYFIDKQIKRVYAKREEEAKVISKSTSEYLYNNIENLKNIKLLNGISFEEKKYNQLLKDACNIDQKIDSLNNLNDSLLLSLVINLLFSSVIGFGAWMFLSSRSTTIGDMVLMLLFAPMVFYSFKIIIDTKISSRHFQKEFSNLNDIFQLRPENRAYIVQNIDEIYSLKFKDVYYNYGKNSPFILKDISFDLKKGEKLGILGLSKSGKTTIADLVMKIIRPRQGSIMINNCDINRVNTYYLRELISIVPQDFRLTKETIVENITYPYSFDDYKYNDALNKCHLKPLIYSLENKENTNINDINLAPSDSQRLALANAFYKDAKIFVFDEVTSKMDQQMEKEMMESIYRLKNKIMIIISNRIYNLVKCDKILILNNGKIVEYGKTSDLLSDKKSTFAKLLKDSQEDIG